MTDHDRLIYHGTKIEAMAEDLAEIKLLLKTLVTQHEFGPIRTVVYGMCGAVLIAVMGTMLTSLGLRGSK